MISSALGVEASEDAEISVIPSKQSYGYDEPVGIAGTVETLREGNTVDVSIRIAGPLKDGLPAGLVAFEYVRPYEDGSFEITIPSEGKAWKAGEYQILAGYESVQTVTFYHAGSSEATAEEQPPAEEPMPEITINTDKPSYKRGDIIIFSGTTDNEHAGKMVSVAVYGPNEGFVHLSDGYANKGSFEIKVNTGSSSFSRNSEREGLGTYRAVAYYPAEPSYQGKSTTFEFVFVEPDKPPASGENPRPSIAVFVEQEAYRAGDIIGIYGTVGERLAGFPVTIQVIAANGNLVTVEQASVSEQKTYELVLDDTDGALWGSSGTYTIKASYGTESRTASTTFEFEGTREDLPDGKEPENTLSEVELKRKIRNLQSSLAESERENQNLRKANAELLQQVESLQRKVSDLTAIINEQIKVIYQWVVSR